MTDHELAQFAARVQVHVWTGLESDNALNWCRFMQPGNTRQQYDCCVWLVAEFYGAEQ